MDFSERGKFLLKVFQDWVYQYLMEAHNHVFCFVFNTPHQNSQLPDKSSEQNSQVTILSRGMTD